MKNKKVLDYVAIGVIVLLLAGTGLLMLDSSSSEVVVVIDGDLDLEQYRANGIPLECRLPVYESRVESWKDHLTHHEDTWYCLEYYE